MAMTDDPWNRFIVRAEMDEPRDDAEADLFALLFYQSEIYNGGHHQYFWNRAARPEEWARALRGAERIGAADAAENLSDAIAIWTAKSRQISMNAIAFREGALEGEFEGCDDKFYEMEDDFQDRFEATVARLEEG